MNPELLNIIGILGSVFLVIAYYPQLYKIIKNKKAEDISLQAWIITLVGHLLLLSYGIIQGNTLITMLFTVFCVENIAIILLTHKYGEKEKEAPLPPHSKDTL